MDNSTAPGLWLVRTDDQPRVHWRNGGGWTRELLAWPRADDWTLRISVADVETSGPFSAFPRVDRWIGIVSGAGLRLCTEGLEPVVLEADSALHGFAGDAPTDCRLVAGASRDFNLMVHRDRARVRIANLGDSPQPHPRAIWAGCFTVHAGRVRVGDRPWQSVGPLSLAWIAPPDTRALRFEPGGERVRGWLIELHDPA